MCEAFQSELKPLQQWGSSDIHAIYLAIAWIYRLQEWLIPALVCSYNIHPHQISIELSVLLAFILPATTEPYCTEPCWTASKGQCKHNASSTLSQWPSFILASQEGQMVAWKVIPWIHMWLYKHQWTLHMTDLLEIQKSILHIDNPTYYIEHIILTPKFPPQCSKNWVQ